MTTKNHTEFSPLKMRWNVLLRKYSKADIELMKSNLQTLVEKNIETIRWVLAGNGGNGAKMAYCNRLEKENDRYKKLIKIIS